MDQKSIYNRDYVKNWRYLFKWELISFLGRLFFNRKPPRNSKLLHLGCGEIYLTGFVNADFYNKLRIPSLRKSIKYDWLLDLRYKLNCGNDYWEGIFTEHTIEHLHYSDCLSLFKELYRTMKKGSYLRICIPALESVLKQENEKLRAEAIYNLTQNYGHLSVWDTDLIFEVLRDAGFSAIERTGYLTGADKRLLQDSENRAKESIYIEVQK
jgi:predicted SAM-dependent methyltransferase